MTIEKSDNDPAYAKLFYSTSPGVWTQYVGPFTVEPGTNVSAYSTHENALWEDSEIVTSTFNNEAVKLRLALNVPKNPITYAEAGGSLMAGDYTPVGALAPITVTLASEEAIPNKYENSDNFEIRWTYDGSDPLSSETAQTGETFTNGYTSDSIDYSMVNWDGAALLPIKIVAASKNASIAESSDVIPMDIGVHRTELPSPIMVYNENTRRGDSVELEFDVDSGDVPTGARIYYTVDGTDPGDDGNGNPITGTLYTGEFDPLVEEEFATEATVYRPHLPTSGLRCLVQR